MSFGKLAWFTTSRGQFYMKIAATGTAFGIFSIQYLPHTFLLNHYRDFVGLRRNGKPYPLTAELKNTFDKVLDDIKVPAFSRKFLEPFMVYGYDVWHAGSIYGYCGAKIGLPINYTYKKPGEIDKSGIIINDEFVNWNRKEARSLLEALILPENAKKFAIAREIFMVDNHNAIIQPLISCFLFFTYYILTSSINERMQLFDKPRQLRYFIYGALGLFMWGIWAMQKDVMTRYYEYDADERASKLGIEYTKGGLEFYSKVIQRNIALRELGGSNGAKTYTKGGNDTITFREKHIPNTSRKQFFEQALKDHETGNVSDTEAELAIA
ncbi:transmembrane protein 177 [Chelonus insularis]|uniref:transmembrane protein 177 n=1 Tax=Chelonus insularis TaxID=460826 RepID=UPI001589E42D|nr:transmembrane protein 177 [Chelonus insularis]